MELTFTKSNVLLADQGSVEGKFLRSMLSDNGFEVSFWDDPAFDPATLKCRPPDVVIVDIDIKESVAEVQQKLYWMKHFCGVPIVALVTADFVLSLSGASLKVDHFVFKPFEVKHLLAIIHTVPKPICGGGCEGCAQEVPKWPEVDRRKNREFTQSNLAKLSVVPVLGRIKIDVLAKDVYCDNRALGLSPKEFSLLRLLLTKHGNLASEEEISEALWPRSAVTSVVIRQYIYRLRRKMRPLTSAESPETIETVRGLGYRLVESSLTSKLENEMGAR